MNLNSQALLEDNLLWQAKNSGKRIIFYGDDTWVRLFPKHFLEYDGTTSFFVSDYTEVRDNTGYYETVCAGEDKERGFHFNCSKHVALFHSRPALIIKKQQA